MMPLKELGYRVLSVPYAIVFKEQMSREAHEFFLSTSYVATGALFGALLTFAFNILAARVLGPASFGSLSLITTLSVIFALSMQFVLTPTIKYASGARDDAERATIMSTSSILIVAFTAVSTAIYLLFAPQLAHVLGVAADVYLFAVAYAVSLVFLALTMNALRILLRMRAYALFSAAQSVILLAVFLTFIGNNIRSWQAAASAIIIANAAITIILVAYLRTYLKPQLDLFWSRRILHYAVLALPGAIAGAFLGVDRILINAFLTTADVGIYNAYFLPSLTVSALLWGIFNATFFPYASRRADKRTLFRSINRAVPYLMVAFVPLFIVLEAIAFFFYGRQYPFSVETSFFFALASATALLYSCYSWLIASVGTSGAKVNTLGNILVLAVLVILDVVLIPRIGIFGAAVTLFFAYLVPTLFLISRRHILGGGEAKVGPFA